MDRIPDSGSDDMSSILIGCTKKVDVPDGVSIFFFVVVQGIIRGVISVFSVISKFRILYLLSVLSKPPDVLKKMSKCFGKTSGHFLINIKNW